jgi:hypothetical protein
MTGFKSKKGMAMSRFAVVYEDPSYEYEEPIDEEFVVSDELAKIVDGWVRLTVAEKQHEVYSPFQTSNS